MKYNILSTLPLLLVWLVVGTPTSYGATSEHDVSTARAKRDYTKDFSKTYDVNSRGSIALNNRYGEINVETWGRDQVQIDVQVRVTADNQERANELFDRITIDFTGGGNRATATTSIGQGKKSGFWESLFGDNIIINFGNNSSDFKVYYTVKMPAAAQLETTAKYCDVRLPTLSGANVTNVAYGDLVAGKLTGNNKVEVSYGSARIEELGKSSNLHLRYSEATVRKAYDLEYNGRYGEVEIGTANNVTVDSGYDDVEIEKARKVVVDGNYNDIDLGTVDEFRFDGSYTGYSVDLVNLILEGESSYGDVDIDELGQNFERVYIRTRYADVEIGVPGGRGYDIDVSTRYGDISVSGDGQLNRTDEGSSESVKGKINGSGNGLIDISASYGDISLR